MFLKAASKRSVVGRWVCCLGLLAYKPAKQSPAAQNTLDFAEEEGVDLIVMATHGRTELRRWMYDSVAERVLHGLPNLPSMVALWVF
ncbi:MAG: universal stress protein [Chloroflexi bacterium]|nr:universal stress protein [Chloroflexota bacterium]